MSDLFTRVHGAGYISRGRVSRQQAIEDARRYHEHQMRKAQEFLAIPDTELRVDVVRGSVVTRHVESLLPAASSHGAGVSNG